MIDCFINILTIFQGALLNDVFCGGNDLPYDFEDDYLNELDSIEFEKQLEAGLVLPNCNWRGGTIKRLGNCNLHCGVNRNRLSYPEGCCCYGFSTSTMSPISLTTT